MHKIAIRREFMNTELRTPVSPSQVATLQRDGGMSVKVQPSPQRIFTDEEYGESGATLSQDLSDCDVIFGLKELPPDRVLEDRIHAFFSHTIKGQPKNMAMLQSLIERRCTLIDYERVTDEQGRRLIFFGRYAGLAGMIDSLWALGLRLKHEGIETPLSQMKSADAYDDIAQALADVKRIGAELATLSLPPDLSPLLIGIAGTGNASKGAQEVLATLGAKPLSPPELAEPPAGPGVYQVIFSEVEMVEPRLGLFDPASFAVQDYYRRPGRYRGVFERYLPYLNVLVNCIYWDNRYPRLVTLQGLSQLYDGPDPPRLRMIGDISCDVRGAIEATVRATSPANPVYVYDVETGEAPDGVAGNGPVILAVYNLPAEFPREASRAFGEALLPFIGPLASANLDVPFERCALPAALKRATIVYRGELTPAYKYLEQHL